jgi:hypothetical protein
MARPKHPFLSSVINDLWYEERTERRESVLNLSLTVRDAIPYVSDEIAATLQGQLARILLAETETASLHAEARAFAPDAEIPADDAATGEVRRALHALVRDQKQAAGRADPAAHDAIDAAVKAAAAAHPRLGLSFGYIGNLPTHGWDDRSWKIFAKLATPGTRGACDVSFGGVDTRDLPALAARVADGLDDWCAKLETRLDAHEIRIVGEERIAA